MTTYYVGGRPIEEVAAMQRDVARAAEQRAAAYRERVHQLERVFLSLGASAPVILSDTAAIAEAASTAADAWSKLFDLEQQVGRERERLALLQARLAGTPMPTAFESLDDFKRKDEHEALVAEVDGSRTEIDLMTADAKARRAELEAFATQKARR